MMVYFYLYLKHMLFTNSNYPNSFLDRKMIINLIQTHGLFNKDNVYTE